MTSDEADALAGRAKTTSAQHYVLHDLKSFTDKYVKAWSDFGIDIVSGKVQHDTKSSFIRRTSDKNKLIFIAGSCDFVCLHGR